jgi:PRC-barrel domain protein
MPGYADFHNWLEKAVQDSNGEQIGHADGIYADNRTGEPTFLLVRGGHFGMHLHFVPLQGAEQAGEDIKVAWDKDTIANAPKISADDSLSPEEERQLFDHYSIHFGDEPEEGAAVIILERWTYSG